MKCTQIDKIEIGKGHKKGMIRLRIVRFFFVYHFTEETPEKKIKSLQ